MVFDDRTDTNDGADPDTAETRLPERTVSQRVDLEALGPGEVTDAHPAPTFDAYPRPKPARPSAEPEDLDDLDGGAYDPADPPTIIDQSLSDEVQRALAPSLPPDTDPALDDRLANVAIALEATDDELAAPVERTVRTTSPFEVSVAPLAEHDQTIPEPSSVEKTQRARVPFDLKVEHTLPPTSRKQEDPPRAPVVIERVSPGAVPGNGTRSERPGPTPERDPNERTSLDIAAALGMAPEPAPPRPAHERAPSPPPGEELRVPEKGAGAKLALGLDEPKAKKGPAKEGLRSDQLANLAAGTDRIARIIPIALGLLVVLATIAVSVRLFERKERQEHVELRFMAIGSDRPVTKASSAGTPIVIETEPPGLLVLYERKVLGKTPFTGSVPIELDNNVAVELSSPYFERWLGEVRRGPAGDFTIIVNLDRKARR